MSDSDEASEANDFKSEKSEEVLSHSRSNRRTRGRPETRYEMKKSQIIDEE